MNARVARAEFPAMSTTVALTGTGISAAELDRATSLGRHLAATWEERFSRFRPRSLLCRFNAANGAAIHADDDFLSLLERVKLAVRHTGGRFDPSILPALEAAGYDRSIEQVQQAPHPTARAPAAAAGAAGWDEVAIDRGRGEVRMPPGMRIDLGGIAKGAFVDRLARELAGWPGGCIDAGGDLRVWGTAPRGAYWAIGIEDPFQPERDLLIARIEAGTGVGVATSGVHRRRWRAGSGSAHHLIDPGRGLPLAGDAAAVTAFASDVAAAEIATKALLIAAATAPVTELFGATAAVLVSINREVDLIHEEYRHDHPVRLHEPAHRAAGAG